MSWPPHTALAQVTDRLWAAPSSTPFSAHMPPDTLAAEKMLPLVLEVFSSPRAVILLFPDFLCIFLAVLSEFLQVLPFLAQLGASVSF